MVLVNDQYGCILIYATLPLGRTFRDEGVKRYNVQDGVCASQLSH
jgi:hypothetical protein